MRIKELEELLKTQKKYDNYFTGNILDSNSLQSELSVLQKPIIDAIIEEKPKEKLILNDKSTQDSLVAEEKPKDEEDDLNENIREILESETTTPFIPKDLIINIKTLSFPNLIPQNYDYSLPDGRKYQMFFYPNPKVNIVLFSDGDELNFSINEKIYKYSETFLDIILGKKDKIKNTKETKDLVEIYFNEVIKAKHINSPYYNFLESILGKPKRGRSKSASKKGKGFGPINLFEKLTLLISAAKSGHDNLENDIKKVCKKLKIMGLISDKIYDKYKGKYFNK